MESLSRCEKLKANRTAIAEDEAVMVGVAVTGWVWVLVMFILKIKNPAPFGNRAGEKFVRLFSFALLPVKPQNGTGEVSAGYGDLGDDYESGDL